MINIYAKSAMDNLAPDALLKIKEALHAHD
jgi:hypothetical protein